MTVLPYVLLALLAWLAWYGYRRQGETYEQLIAILERSREEARHEAEVFRRLVLPVYDRAEKVSLAASSSPQPLGGKVATPTPAEPARSSHSIVDRRIPWRIRFKQAVRWTNTKQKATDTLAAALRTQKPAQKPSEKTA